jgi:hypothetical protein
MTTPARRVVGLTLMVLLIVGGWALIRAGLYG